MEEDRRQSLFPESEDEKEKMKALEEAIPRASQLEFVPMSQQISDSSSGKNHFKIVNGKAQGIRPIKCFKKDYTLSPLVIGPGYDLNDISINVGNVLRDPESGVQLFTVNNDDLALKLQSSKFMSTYRIKARLGFLTDNGFGDGKVIQKSTYDLFKRHKLDKALSSISGSQRNQMLKAFNIKGSLQESYELLSKGLITRPSSDFVGTLIYNVKCVHFKPPEFTLEMTCCMPQFDFIKNFVTDIGFRLNTNATATSIRCLRSGPFHADQSLLLKELTLENVLNNIIDNQKLVDENIQLLNQNTTLNKQDLVSL